MKYQKEKKENIEAENKEQEKSASHNDPHADSIDHPDDFSEENKSGNSPPKAPSVQDNNNHPNSQPNSPIPERRRAASVPQLNYNQSFRPLQHFRPFPVRQPICQTNKFYYGSSQIVARNVFLQQQHLPFPTTFNYPLLRFPASNFMPSR